MASRNLLPVIRCASASTSGKGVYHFSPLYSLPRQMFARSALNLYELRQGICAEDRAPESPTIHFLALVFLLFMCAKFVSCSCAFFGSLA